MEVPEHPGPALRLTIRPLAALLVLVLVAACGSIDKAPLATLQAMDEASLFFPGSTQLATFGDDQQTGSITGPQSAFFGYQLGTEASDAEVEAFYEAELGDRGWSTARPDDAITIGIRSSTDSRARAWEKGDAFFRLSFRRRDKLGGLDDQNLAGYPTIYEFRLRTRIP